MSGRLLKKVLKEQEEAAAAQQLTTGDESDSPDSSAPSSSKNPFDLLNDDDDHKDNESDTADEYSSGKAVEKEFSQVKETFSAVPVSNHKSKKKKKKKNKDSSSNKTGVENALKVLDNLSIEAGASSHGQGVSKVRPAKLNVGDGRVMKQCTMSSLQVDPKFLSAENELRRIFGSKVVNSFEKNNQTGSSRQIRGGRRGSHTHRKTILVSGSDHWPRWDGSISMEYLGIEDGYKHFRYEHSASYKQAQRAFEAAQAINDLNGVASVLLYHPYHIDSLVTLAEYFKFSGEHQMAADATAKILYAFECAWDPMFTPLQGNCQLKYCHDNNKPFLDTLFVHMKNMDRRGCHRSALEICKLLLSLDTDDPKGALRCIDYFSLRAEEYSWLEHFSEEYKGDNSLWLFPNYSFSLAITRFYLERSKDRETDDAGKATSTELMKQALMLHPSVLRKLVEKVPLKDQAWTSILKHSFFRPNQTGNSTLDHLILIYIEKSYLIWRLPDLQKLLRDCAVEVIGTLEHGEDVARDWLCVRNEAFPSDKNEYAHLLVSDFSDSVPTMPPEILQNFMVDPRMLEEMQNGGGRQQHQQVVDPPHEGGARVRDVTNRNALAVLFESMLPWVDYGRAGEHEQPPDNNNDNA